MAGICKSSMSSNALRLLCVLLLLASGGAVGPNKDPACDASWINLDDASKARMCSVRLGEGYLPFTFFKKDGGRLYARCASCEKDFVASPPLSAQADCSDA